MLQSFSQDDLDRLAAEAAAGLPDIALSVQQPWAWAIVTAGIGKDIENRDWSDRNPGLRFRGRCAIHAGVGMTRDDYEDAAYFMAGLGVTCPPALDLPRGGIVGSVEVVDVVTSHPSRWFFGPCGLVLRSPRSTEFVPAKGQLGFFRWTRSGGTPAEPARWMLGEGRRRPVGQPKSAALPLFQ